MFWPLKNQRYQTFFIAVALSAVAVQTNANSELCGVVNRIVADRSVDAFKENWVGFDRWHAKLKVDGFNKCSIVNVPEDIDPTLTSTDTVECDVWLDALDAAIKLRDNSLASLTCGEEAASFPGLSEESRSLFFPASGLALSLEIQPRALDFSVWRRELRENDPRTTAYKYKVTISIQAIFPKP